MATSRSFWAWHRRGLAAALTGSPAAGAARAGIPVTVSLDAAHTQDVPVDLLGPGDVAALDPAEVTRTEPADGCPDFEPSAMPYVELRHADLPWRFTPHGPQSADLSDPEHRNEPPSQQRRLRPWLGLVVVEESAATLTTTPRGGPALQCDAALLPAPEDLWAWAHVQLGGESAGASAETLSDPTRAFARILCPIQLAADQRYVACLVPTYAAGLAAAGISGGAGNDPLGPGWPPTGQVTLPVYLTWRFATTGAGSFETLARRLRPRPVPAAAHGVPLRIDSAGWGAKARAGTTVVMQGALRPLGPATDEPPADAGFASSLASVVSASGVGLELRPPLYGQDHMGGATAVTPGVAGWFTSLNTDARRRFAAGLGAWAVAIDQDDLCDEAWRQLAAARPGGVAGPGAEIAEAVLGALVDRHGISTLTGPSGPSGPSDVPGPSGLSGLGHLAGPGTVRLLRPGGPLARVGFASAAAGLGVGAEAGPEPFLTRRRTGHPVRGTARRTDGRLNGRLGGGTSGGDDDAGVGVPALSGRFSPTFEDPAFARLRAIAAEWILPGLEDLPEDSVILVRTNPAFVESFLIGLNHALARELQWRRFPLEVTGTMFGRFWPGAASVAPLASWDPISALGTHVGAASQVVVVLRGSLLRRFPTTTIYLSGQRPGQVEEQVVLPTVSASVGVDTTLVGFPMSVAELSTPSVPGQVWSVVLQESVTHARFGLDDAPADGTIATLNSWADLDWSHPQVAGHRHVPVAGPLAGVTRPTGPTTPLGTPEQARWAADSGAMAAALNRVPVRVRIPASLWLNEDR